MGKLLLFIRAAGKAGIVLVTGSAASAAFAMWQLLGGKAITGWLAEAVAVILLLYAAYLAWSHEHDARLIVEQKLSDVPLLRVAEQQGFYNDMRTLRDLDMSPQAKISCLNVRFKNDPKGCTPNSVARNILADLEFHDGVSDLLLFQMRGRWGDTPEPPRLSKDQTPEEKLATVDFGIGQERELNIAFKYLDESDSFGVSNEMYRFSDWKHPKQQMSSKDVRVRVRLRGVGVDASWDFWFINPTAGELRPIKQQVLSASR